MSKTPQSNEQGEASEENTPPETAPAPKPATMKVRKRGRVHPLKWGALVACIDVVGLIVVVSVALPRYDLAAGVYGGAGVLALLSVLIYTMAYQFKNWLLQWIALGTRVSFSAVLAVILWDVHRPHKVWQGEQFEMSEFTPSLLFVALCFLTSAGLLVAHAVFLGRGYRSVAIRVRASSGSRNPKPNQPTQPKPQDPEPNNTGPSSEPKGVEETGRDQDPEPHDPTSADQSEETRPKST